MTKVNSAEGVNHYVAVAVPYAENRLIDPDRLKGPPDGGDAVATEALSLRTGSR